MRRAVVALALAAAGLAPATVVVPHAQAAGLPTYTCDWVGRHVNDNFTGVGEDCSASNDAPTSGPVWGRFVLKSRKQYPARTMTCYEPSDRNDPSGSAKDYPSSVQGDSCN